MHAVQIACSVPSFSRACPQPSRLYCQKQYTQLYKVTPLLCWSFRSSIWNQGAFGRPGLDGEYHATTRRLCLLRREAEALQVGDSWWGGALKPPPPLPPLPPRAFLPARNTRAGPRGTLLVTAGTARTPDTHQLRVRNTQGFCILV
jgi:hypothetical protein